jgi:hypothetical protein
VVAATPHDPILNSRDRLRTDSLLQLLGRVHARGANDIGGLASRFRFGECLLSDGRPDENRLALPFPLAGNVHVKANVPRLPLADHLSALT